MGWSYRGLLVMKNTDLGRKMLKLFNEAKRKRPSEYRGIYLNKYMSTSAYKKSRRSPIIIDNKVD